MSLELAAKRAIEGKSVLIRMSIREWANFRHQLRTLLIDEFDSWDQNRIRTKAGGEVRFAASDRDLRGRRPDYYDGPLTEEVEYLLAFGTERLS